MKDSYKKRVLILALFAGELMMKAGAEIYRVEDTVVRICKACGVDYAECFATTTGIIVSLDTADDDADMYTFIKRISGTSIDLTKISLLNQFSRIFTATDLSASDGFEQLRSIDSLKVFPLIIRMLGAMLVGAAMITFYSGGPLDIACAAVASLAAFLLSYAISKLQFPPFIRIFLSCTFSALLVLFLASAGLAIKVEPVLIAAVTIFMPGVSITNAARDLLSGDMQAGVARFVEALITAVAIAGGEGLMLQIGSLLKSPSLSTDSVIYPTPLFLLFGAITTLGFCLLFHAPIRQIPLIVIIGGIGQALYITAQDYGIIDIGSCFLGTCAVAILAECASRAGKDATTIFILPCIIPFVPGTTVFRTMESILNGEFSDAASYASEAILTAGAIAVSLILIASLTRLIMALAGKIAESRRVRAKKLNEAEKEEIE